MNPTPLVTHLNDIAQYFKDAGEHWKAQAFVKAAITLSKGPELTFKNGVLQDKIPGVGKAIKDAIEEFTASGKSRKLENLKKEAAQTGSENLVYLQEITEWDSPNHIYLVEDSKAVGYVQAGTKDIQMFSKGLSFDKRGRKFKTLTKTQIKSLQVC